MRRFILAFPILLFVAAPLAAQLTPEQRAAVERKPSAAKSTAFYNAIEERALNGDATAWFGPAALEASHLTDERLWAERRRNQPQLVPLTPGAFQGSGVLSASEGHDHWFAIGQRAIAPTRLRRAPQGQVDVRAEVPLALTLASPIGGVGRPLMIRTNVGATTSTGGWTKMGEVAPDGNGNYRIEVPALHAGTYELRIEVYDLNVPETPYSTSRSTLIAWMP